jgi:hypothetical protein
LKRRNFPHALEALDGKHIRIRNPDRADSLYYNYKEYFSIGLMALVDADYRFIWAEVGTNETSFDAQIFNSCELKEARRVIYIYGMHLVRWPLSRQCFIIVTQHAEDSS